MKRKILFGGIVLIGLSLLLTAFTTKTYGQETKPWKISGKYVAMKNPTKPNAADLKIGKTLFAKHCKSCHGTNGAGDGSKAAGLKTKFIGDFTKGFGKQSKDGEIYYKTFIGRDEMPGFEKKISDEEDRWIIINYIKSLKK
ncbi:c-type cytochrome [Bacteroidota bacterium]